jgi:hypothetical protein
MWFSNNKSYGDAFAYYYSDNGLKARTVTDKTVPGKNFLSAIPKKGRYRRLAGPIDKNDVGFLTIADYWQNMPFILKNNHIYRTPYK